MSVELQMLLKGAVILANTNNLQKEHLKCESISTPSSQCIPVRCSCSLQPCKLLYSLYHWDDQLAYSPMHQSSSFFLHAKCASQAIHAYAVGECTPQANVWVDGDDAYFFS